jgi:chromosome segregation ATPase
MTKRDTRKELELAIARIRHGRPKIAAKERRISISAVAVEAGLSPTTIHNRYPDIADRIRGLMAESNRGESGKKVSTELPPKGVIRELRLQLTEREKEIRRLGSINLRMMSDLNTAQAEIDRLRSATSVLPLKNVNLKRK